MTEKSITNVRFLKYYMKHHLNRFILNTQHLFESGKKFTDSICTQLLTKNFNSKALIIWI